MTDVFAQRCLIMQKQRFMQTNKTILKLPRPLDELTKIQDAHRQATAQNVIVQWREYLTGEIGEILQDKFNFFEPDVKAYEKSQTKRVILRFEYMLNTYLRDFVNTSLTDWVDFIKTFTLPKYEDGELWKRSSTPMIVINLKEKKQKKKGSNTIEYSPSLAECAEFMTSALKKIQDSTNAVLTFENDLMTFLELDSSPTFRLTADFPWVADAL